MLAAEDLITKRGAWPKSWPHNPSIDQLKVLLRDTGFGVPDDLISATRSAFGKKLLEKKFPDGPTIVHELPFMASAIATDVAIRSASSMGSCFSRSSRASTACSISPTTAACWPSR